MPIEIREIEIREIPAPAVPEAAPVTLQLAPPVINLPGCAAVHPDAGLNPSLLRDDPSRVGYSCPEGTLPTFNAMDWRPSEMVILEAEPEPQKPKQETPPAASPSKLPELPAPPDNKPKPVEVQEEKPSLPQQVLDGLPPAKDVVTTASIALVATTSALVAKPLADLLLKLIKPAIKKVVAKAKAMAGRKPKVLSVDERRLAQRDRNRALLALRRALGK